MTIKQKLLQVLKDKEVTEYKFYKETGVSRGTLSNSSGLNEDTITKFFAYFPDVDANLIFKSDNVAMDRLKSIYENIDPHSTKDQLIDAQYELIGVYKKKIEALELELKGNRSAS